MSENVDGRKAGSVVAGVPRTLAVGILAGAIAFLLILVVGLPAGTSVFGTPLSDLTLPVALFVGFGIVAVAAAVETSVPWRVVDIVVASVLGVASGLVFWAWSAAYTPVSTLFDAFPPAAGLLTGGWLFAAVLGGLIIRKPGAAVYTELVAGIVESLLGNHYGFSSVWYSLVEGMGAEVVFAVLLYRAWGLVAALLAGAGAGATVGIMDTFLYQPTFSLGWKLLYIGCSVVSGVVVAGLGSWALTRALAASGALAALPSGRAAERV